LLVVVVVVVVVVGVVGLLLLSVHGLSVLDSVLLQNPSGQTSFPSAANATDLTLPLSSSHINPSTDEETYH
jgi:hypothetical protein